MASDMVTYSPTCGQTLQATRETGTNTYTVDMLCTATKRTQISFIKLTTET